MSPLLIPFVCTSSTEMKAIGRVSDSRQFSGTTTVGLSKWSANPGSKIFARTLCPYKLSVNVSRSFHHSLAPNRKRWLHLSRKMNATSDVLRNKVVSQNLADENSSDTLATRVIKFCKSLTVLAVVSSTVLGHTSARAGVESTLQPKFNKRVVASTNNISSVEAILARQLARRFREMSDEELILVLQELLKASRSSISPEDLVLDGKGREDFLSKDGIKEDSRKLINDGPITKDPIPEAKGSEAGNGGPDLSPASSKFAGSTTKKQKENSYKPVDGTDRAPEPEGREVKSEVPEKSVPGSNVIDQARKQGNSVPGTERAPSVGKEAVSEEALTPKNSRLSGGAIKEPDEEQFSERSDNVEESESQDMTVMLWDEWRRRLQGQTLAEPTNEQESRTVASATDFWQNMQALSRSALKGVSIVSAWISDNQETVGGGVVASGGIIVALFIRQKILFLSLGKGNKNGDLTVDRTPKKAQLSASNLKSSQQDLWGFLQDVELPFKPARSRLLGLEQNAGQAEKASSGTTSNRSGENTTAGSSTGESVPASWPSEDDMLPNRPEARGKSANTIQDLSSYGVGLSKPSEQLPDRFVKRTNDIPKARFKSGPENRDGGGPDDFRTVKPSDLQGRKNAKNDDVVYSNSQFPPSTSATVHDKSKSSEFPPKDETVTTFIPNLSPLIGTRGLPGTSNTKEERNSAAKSFRENVQGMTIGKQTGAESSQKVELALPERKEEDGEISGFEFEFLQKDSTYQTRDSDVKGYSVRESANKPSFGLSSRSWQDRLASASIDSDEIDGASSRKTMSSKKSDSFVSGRSDLDDSKVVALSPVQQVTKGEEVTSDSVGFRDSLQSSKTSSPTDEGSNRFEDAGLFSDLSQKTHNEEIPETGAVKQYPVAGDSLVNDRPTLVRNSEKSSLLDEAEHAENKAGSQGDSADRGAKFMDTQTEVLHLEKVNAQSSDSDVQYSIAEQIEDGDNLSESIFSTGVEESALKIHSKSNSEREPWEVSEKEMQDGKVAETPVSSDESAIQIEQGKMHDDGMISSTTFRKRVLESEADEDKNSAETSASTGGGGGGGDQGIDILQEDFWAGGLTTAFVPRSSKHSTNDSTTEDKFDNSRPSSSGGSEVESKRVGLSRAALDSFSHKQDFWVRDSDGVFIKHPRENQGMILQDREGSRVPGYGGSIKNEVMDASIASKRVFNKLDKYAKPASKEGLHKQAKRFSSEFDYGQLYLTPNDDNKNSGEPYCKVTESKRYITFPSPSNTGKTRPIRYGVEKSP